MRFNPGSTLNLTEPHIPDAAWEDDYQRLVETMEIDGGICHEECTPLLATVVAAQTKGEPAA